MASKEIERKRNDLLADLTETACRIRRYSLDPRLRMNTAPAAGPKKPSTDSDFGEYLRQEAEAACVTISQRCPIRPRCRNCSRLKRDG